MISLGSIVATVRVQIEKKIPIRRDDWVCFFLRLQASVKFTMASRVLTEWKIQFD